MINDKIEDMEINYLNVKPKKRRYVPSVGSGLPSSLKTIFETDYDSDYGIRKSKSRKRKTKSKSRKRKTKSRKRKRKKSKSRKRK